jgi:Flp pilus assembly pilin Flp
MKIRMSSVNWRLISGGFSRFFRENGGTTAIEYGLLAGLIALGIVNMLYITRSSLQYPLLSVYSSIISAIQGAA